MKTPQRCIAVDARAKQAEHRFLIAAQQTSDAALTTAANLISGNQPASFRKCD
jgi:hypothetical protein